MSANTAEPRRHGGNGEVHTITSDERDSSSASILPSLPPPGDERIERARFVHPSKSIEMIQLDDVQMVLNRVRICLHPTIGLQTPEHRAFNAKMADRLAAQTRLVDLTAEQLREIRKSLRGNPDEGGNMWAAQQLEAMVDAGYLGDHVADSPEELRNELERRWEQDREQDRVKAHEWTVNDEFARQLVRHEAQEKLRAYVREERSKNWEPPETEWLTDLLERPVESQRMLITDMFGEGHNVTLTAPFKTGKTTAGLNVVKRLVDGEPFLGNETHLGPLGCVGWLNGEMTPLDLKEYAERLGIVNTQRVAVQHLRGRGMNIMSDHVVDWLVEWLIDHMVSTLVIDSWAKLLRWAGVKENENDGAGAVTERIDEIKERAGVDNCLILAHTGRKKHEDGEEHARGATALDDWVDVRWVMAKVHGQRFMYAVGRGVQWGGDTGTALVFDEVTNLLTLGEGSRAEVRADRGSGVVEEIVKGSPGIKTGEIKVKLAEVLGIKNAAEQVATIQTAVGKGLVHSVKDGVANRYHLGPDPALASRMEWARKIIEPPDGE